MHLCTCASTYLNIRVFICPCISRSMYPYIPASLYPCIHVSLCLCIHVHNALRDLCIHTPVPMDVTFRVSIPVPMDATFHVSIPVPKDLYPCIHTSLHPYAHATVCPYLPCILDLGQDVTMQEVLELVAASPRLWLAQGVPGSPQTTLSQPRSGISVQSRMWPLGMLGIAAKTKKGGNNRSVNRWKSAG